MLCPGGRKCTHTPRQEIKCSLAGWTRGLALPCPPNPEAWSHLANPLPWQCQAAGLSRMGPLGLQDPECHGAFHGPPPTIIRSTAGPHLQQAWAGGPAQRLAERLAWVRDRQAVAPGLPDGGSRMRRGENPVQQGRLSRKGDGPDTAGAGRGGQEAIRLQRGRPHR